MKWKFRKSVLFSCIAITTVSFVTATSLFLVACANNKIIIPARENISNGLTAIDNDQEKYINQNSASILFYSTPNIQYLTTYLSKYLEDNAEYKPGEPDAPSENSRVTTNEQDTKQTNAYIVTQTLNEILTNGTNGKDYKVTNILLGTTWLLDYSLAQNPNIDNTEATKNLATYYFATNMHVLNVAYNVVVSKKSNDGKTYDLELNVPVSSVSTTNLDVFLSQPQGDKKVDDLGQTIPDNLTIPANNSGLFSTAWYKTPLTKDTFESSIIPGGTTLSKNKSYDLTASLTITDSNGDKQMQSYYYYSDGRNNLSSVDTYDKTVEMVSDFSIIKITDSADNIKLPDKSSRYYNSFLGLKTMLTIDTSKTDVEKNSSYLTKLNYLNSLATNKNSNRSTIDELFLFRDYSSLNVDTTVLSIAGYPSTTDQTTRLVSANFNSNTISYSLSTYTGDKDSTTGYARPSIQYSLNGKFYYSSYNWQDNILMPNVNLMPGSSGSMVIDNDYKLVGIYWGIVQGGENISGVANTLFSKNNSKSLVAKYLNYIKNIDKNSELLKLFRNLHNNFNYFN